MVGALEVAYQCPAIAYCPSVAGLAVEAPCSVVEVSVPARHLKRNEGSESQVGPGSAGSVEDFGEDSSRPGTAATSVDGW